MERYTVSADGQSVTDNRTHAPVPLPKGSALLGLVGIYRARKVAVALWAQSLNS